MCVLSLGSECMLTLSVSVSVSVSVRVRVRVRMRVVRMSVNVPVHKGSNVRLPFFLLDLKNNLLFFLFFFLHLSHKKRKKRNLTMNSMSKLLLLSNVVVVVAAADTDFLSSNPCEQFAQNNKADCAFLTDFYESTKGKEWTNNTGWNTATSFW